MLTADGPTNQPTNRVSATGLATILPKLSVTTTTGVGSGAQKLSCLCRLWPQ